MSIQKNLRSKIANYLFIREARHHKRTHPSVSFDKARTIGILYDATIDRNYELVKSYVKRLREEFKKDVLALGYVDKKDLPDTRMAKLGLDFFAKKNLNWHLKPTHAMVTKFINIDFDILIHLNNEKCFPLKYVCALTKAKFKIGRYDKRNSFIYDFMIDLPSHVTLIQFIEQVNHYLNLIRNEHYQTA